LGQQRQGCQGDDAEGDDRLPFHLNGGSSVFKRRSTVSCESPSAQPTVGQRPGFIRGRSLASIKADGTDRDHGRSRIQILRKRIRLL
jgi:hypothetical protein